MNIKTSEFVSKTNPTEILYDIKSIIGDYYVASFELANDELIIRFTNGQHFVVFVKEV